MSYGRLEPDTPIPGVVGGQTVGDFWAWAFSNILTNITRGLFAEFLVGTALGAVEGKRTEWDSYDLSYGDAHIEVKSSAYLQSWEQDKPSNIGWSISPSTYQTIRPQTKNAPQTAMCSASIPRKVTGPQPKCLTWRSGSSTQCPRRLSARS